MLSHHPFVGAFTPPSPYLCGTIKTLKPSSNSNVGPATQINKIKSKSILLPPKASPSGIDEWPQLSQAAVFFGTYAALGLATYPTTKLLETLSQSSIFGLERWRSGVIDSTLPILLGLFYLLGGIGHFAISGSFQDIYPPIGTWGIWYLPGSPAFHVAWTGVVEIVGGMGLLLSGLRDALASEDDDDDDYENENIWMINFVKPVAASVLFVLTILITPANIYMFTHGAVMGDTMAPLDMSFHGVRFAVQVVFLSLLLTLARDSFFFAWGDELD
eukprot:CAMPEP_0201934998 /NCGR_PEP_ID=MMETSP0903-20130614/34700_1 /ASSEMBLY_ACC=CAM_ASM_000552 /TAXON_ID=420261 /ORGANISM="Thalassiosira antarctica, Strain CCMP982" /LENGTH=272 /DNA_ID=CAMNT_0048475329 /DNA_START=79 /DNA_END=897 /DNA_ORIENTATION=-